MRFPPEDIQAIALRAATLYERRASLDGEHPAAPADATRILQQWNQAFAPGDPGAFHRRLAWDGFDPSGLALALGAVRIQDAAWTGWLTRMADEAPGVLADVHARAFRPGAGDDARPFEEVWAVVLRAGRRALEAHTTPSMRARVTPGVMAAFERQLADEVGRYGDAALLEYFHATANRGPDDTGYRAFVIGLLEGGLVAFLAEYAVLARQLASIVSAWVSTTAELIGRLDADWSAIAATFAGGADPGPVVAVRLALSDPHHGRRRVSVLTFGSGVRVVYKPRSVRIEDEFGALIEWMNQGLDYRLERLAVIDRGTHGWVAFAAHAPMEAPAEVVNYFRQAGALMCLTALLGARDLHRDNLIATRRGPVLVDLELLLQPGGSPVTRPDDPGPQGGAPVSPLSCLSTGMLSLVDLTADGEPHDVGGLRGAAVGALPFPARVWRQCGTDAVHFVETSAVAAAGTHQVWLEGRVERPEARSSDLIAGFAQAYRFLLARSDELLDPSGPLQAFESCAVRLLPRPTNQYAMLAFLLATPKYQHEGVTPGCAIDVLHRGSAASAERPALWPVAIEERRAMLALDVPYFSVLADGLDASADGRVVAVGYFTRSGLRMARDRVRSLSHDDLAMQVATLGRALSEPLDARFLAANAGGHASAGDFVACAERIGGELYARAYRSTDGLIWPYRPLVGGPGWRDHHLYDGSMGVALFFSALAAVTGDAHWHAAAQAALGPIRAHAARHPAGTLPPDEAIGGGNGLGSVLYGLAMVAAFDGDQAWLDLAGDLAGAIEPRLSPAGPVDVISGSAGAALALLALHDVTQDARVLAAARACGRHLLAREVPAGPGAGAWPSADGTRLLGFAHGAAGIACALARLAAATGDASYAGAARRAYRFVRRHHQPVSGNWPIAVDGAGISAGGMMTGWCHGAPGVALSALTAAARRRSTPVLHGIESAMRIVGHWQPAQADHLCCGVFGRIDVLLTAGEQFDRPEATEAATALAARVVERACRRGHFRLSGVGTDYRVFDPGFFQGLSGIGYQLLRAAHPAQLPSVAGFGTPRSSLRYCSPVAGAGGSRRRVSDRPAR